jgi:hypothetical protein
LSGALFANFDVEKALANLQKAGTEDGLSCPNNSQINNRLKFLRVDLKLL